MRIASSAHARKLAGFALALPSLFTLAIHCMAFSGAHHVDARDSIFNDVGRDQNYYITYKIGQSLQLTVQLREIHPQERLWR
jgi:hypothetical protein